jgi:hypothetical protein
MAISTGTIRFNKHLGIQIVIVFFEFNVYVSGKALVRLLETVRMVND